MRAQLLTGDYAPVILQVTHLSDVKADSGGKFIFHRPFVLKNTGADDKTLWVLPAGQDVWVQTTISSGWNAELLKGISASDPGEEVRQDDGSAREDYADKFNNLQYGY